MWVIFLSALVRFLYPWHTSTEKHYIHFLLCFLVSFAVKHHLNFKLTAVSKEDWFHIASSPTRTYKPRQYRQGFCWANPSPSSGWLSSMKKKKQRLNFSFVESSWFLSCQIQPEYIKGKSVPATWSYKETTVELSIFDLVAQQKKVNKRVVRIVYVVDCPWINTIFLYFIRIWMRYFSLPYPNQRPSLLSWYPT